MIELWDVVLWLGIAIVVTGLACRVIDWWRFR
jgi:hypothetical protein